MQKAGFPPIPERALKSVQKRTSCTLSAQKVRSCALLCALSGIGGNFRIFAQINLFAIWALWLEPKLTSLGTNIHYENKSQARINHEMHIV